MFGRTGAPQRGAHSRECRTVATFSGHVGASLWRVPTFKSSLGAARHSAGGCVRHIAKSKINDVAYLFVYQAENV